MNTSLDNHGKSGSKNKKGLDQSHNQELSRTMQINNTSSNDVDADTQENTVDNFQKQKEQILNQTYQISGNIDNSNQLRNKSPSIDMSEFSLDESSIKQNRLQFLLNQRQAYMLYNTNPGTKESSKRNKKKIKVKGINKNAIIKDAEKRYRNQSSQIKSHRDNFKNQTMQPSLNQRSTSQVNSMDMDRLGLKNSTKYAQPDKYQNTLQQNLDFATSKQFVPQDLQSKRSVSTIINKFNTNKTQINEPLTDTNSIHYNPTGPGDYNLPELFKQYMKKEADTPINVKPSYTFGHKHSQKSVISKVHLQEFLSKDTPSPGQYNVLGNFDQYRKKFQDILSQNSVRVNPNNPANKMVKLPTVQNQLNMNSTFGSQARFRLNQGAQDLKAQVPCQYEEGQNVKSTFLNTPKYKTIKKDGPSPDTRRVFESSQNRTFFGIPAKTVSPGPAKYDIKGDLESGSPSLMQSQSKMLNMSASKSNRFNITKNVYHKDYYNDFKGIGVPPATKYNQDPDPLKEKRQFKLPIGDRGLLTMKKSISPSPVSYNNMQNDIEQRSIVVGQTASKNVLHPQSMESIGHGSELSQSMLQPRPEHIHKKSSANFKFGAISKAFRVTDIIP